MVTVDQLRDRLNELIDKIEEVRITQERLNKSVHEINLALEDLDADLYNARFPRPIIETVENLDTYRRSIGKDVRIVNSGPGESDIGVVRSVCAYHVFVALPDGTARRRLPLNLRLREHGERTG